VALVVVLVAWVAGTAAFIVSASGFLATAPHRVAASGTRTHALHASGHAQHRRSPAPIPFNVYAATMTGKPAPSVAGIPERVYVPNSGDGTVTVIDPHTFQIVDRYYVGEIPHHIAPAWDLKALYVDNEGSSTLTVIDPRSGKPVRTIPVPYPYNLYFTPDGTKAIVVVERLSRLDFRDPHTWNLIKSVDIPWPGVDHMDFSADGHYLMASTEWSGIVVKVDTVAMKAVGQVNVGGLPIDVRLSPDGSVFYVANQGRNGVSVVDPVAMKEVGFIPTGAGAHGLVISRDTKSLYVSNRLAGTISVIDCKTRRVVAVWNVGGSPDMLQLSPDGRELWVTGRFDGTVEVVDTRSGAVRHTIFVGTNPHGLTYFPNAGRFSVGHNGVYR
jgi:YVTN family beta-propeller protein